MTYYLLVFTCFIFVCGCNVQNKKPASWDNKPEGKVLPDHSGFYKTIGDVPLPPGFKRTQEPPGSFGEYLRKLPLKEEKTAYLWNGKKKKNQEAQFAVVDLSIGNKDLLQCADVVMKLRAEYLFGMKR